MTVSKIVFVGDENIGKSQLVIKMANEPFQETYTCTIGVDFKIIRTEYRNNPLTLQMWDTGGMERFRAITTSYYRGAKVIVLCIGLNNNYSKDQFQTRVNEIKKLNAEAAIIIVATMMDTICGSCDFMLELQNYDFPFVALSAKTGENFENFRQILMQQCASDHQISYRQFNNGPRFFDILNLKFACKIKISSPEARFQFYRQCDSDGIRAVYQIDINNVPVCCEIGESDVSISNVMDQTPIQFLVTRKPHQQELAQNGQLIINVDLDQIKHQFYKVIVQAASMGKIRKCQ